MTRPRISRPVLVAATGVLSATALTACVGGQVDPEEAEEAQAGADDLTFRFAHVYDPNHPVETCGVPAIQDALEGSGVTIESFPAAQLGSEAELLEQVSAGSLDIAVAGPSFLGVWYEDAAVLDGGYIFDDVEEFTETIDSDVVQDIWAGLYEESGLKVETSWYYGTRHVTSNTPVNTPEDLAGLKLRTPDAPLYLTNIDTMGGTATPMALDEVYTALQQGTIDAQENPIPTIDSFRLNEVQDYINLTGHSVQSVQIVTSDAMLDQLTEDQRSAWDEAMTTSADAVRECIVSAEEETLEAWREDGSIEINDDVDREAFAEQVRDELPGRVPWGETYRDIVEGS
ncbi:DctP family TRAP transporter solute-binding subunit [Georgenia deserti]|uniref:DctP family TRAP transporter solute-binding subunit n=1 Tax=Georgenia deserti TaxID=2093781 RepID=A0ABW4L4A9_9MICO